MPELRKDPITGRWVIIATDRAKRPTDFVREKVEIRGSGFCPFCAGNEARPRRKSSPTARRQRPQHARLVVRVVPNKFPALGIEGDT